jgi:hypothetical protein
LGFDTRIEGFDTRWLEGFGTRVSAQSKGGKTNKAKMQQQSTRKDKKAEEDLALMDVVSRSFAN